MTTEFGTTSNDQGSQGTGDNTSGNEGATFGQNVDSTTNATNTAQGIDPAEYEALRRRDEHAQQHIPRLESENEELRNKIVELESRLASATTLDEALARIANKGEGQAIDRADVAQVVRDVLGETQTAEKMDSNWNTIVDTLTKKYGEWKAADAAVQERARELDISLEEATKMAKNNPKVFRTLFNLDTNSATSNPAGSHGAGAQGQRGISSAPGQVRDKAYYSNLRKTDPNKYWSIDVQTQMRRDLFNS
jgi:hypothetical protein